MIIALIALVLLVILPAQAQTITMANPDNVGQRDIMVYWSNGSLYGLYNTTSIITLDANESYIFTLKPQLSNPLDNPATFLSTIFTFVETNIIPLSILIFLAALWLGRK
jgi:hypothetical protein